MRMVTTVIVVVVVAVVVVSVRLTRRQWIFKGNAAGASTSHGIRSRGRGHRLVRQTFQVVSPWVRFVVLLESVHVEHAPHAKAGCIRRLVAVKYGTVWHGAYYGLDLFGWNCFGVWNGTLETNRAHSCSVQDTTRQRCCKLFCDTLQHLLHRMHNAMAALACYTVPHRIASHRIASYVP